MQDTVKILRCFAEDSENRWLEADKTEEDLRSSYAPSSSESRNVTVSEDFNHKERVTGLENIAFSGISCRFGDLSAIESFDDDFIVGDSRHSKSPNNSVAVINQTELQDFHVISSTPEMKKDSGNLFKFNSVTECSGGSPTLENNLSLELNGKKKEKSNEILDRIIDDAIKKYEGSVTKEVAKSKHVSVQTLECGLTVDAHCQCDLYQISALEYLPRKISTPVTFGELSPKRGRHEGTGQLSEIPKQVLSFEGETNVQVKNDSTPRNCSKVPRIRVGLSRRIKSQHLHNY